MYWAARKIFHGLIVCAFAAGLVCASCATRTNPDLPPSDGDGDSDVDADSDTSHCGAGSHFCEDRCVAIDAVDHCGLCGRACSTAGGCDCLGDPPQCLNTSSHFCFEGCSTGELICDSGGEAECIIPNQSGNCGGCGVECETTEGCMCRDTGSTGIYECLRSVSGEIQDCTRTDP